MAADLLTLRCTALPPGHPPLDADDIAGLAAALHGDWRIEGNRLVRRFALKGYAQALMLANAAGFLAEREDHHPEITFGWGFCEVSWWTHTVRGLSLNDFICAAKLDAMVLR